VFIIKVLQSNKVYTGGIIDVYAYEVELQDGKIAHRDVVRHRAAVAVLAIDNEDNVLVVKQYRYPIANELIELPAGLVDEGETPLEAAKRELREETGYIANSWDKLISFYTSPGSHDEKIYIFLAKGIKKVGDQQLDEGEILTYNKVPYKELLKWIKEGRITDAKTIIGLIIYAYDNMSL
jgi:ADP-ribose pyrophosphatase